MAEDVRIKKINVTQQVAEYIDAKIESGEWPENSKIDSEAQLSEKLGVSRISIRGAIRQFVALGKLESIQGKGTFVRNSGNRFPEGMFSNEDSENLKKVMQFRVTIEQDAAFYAAKSVTESDILYLQKNISLMHGADQVGDAALSWSYDMQFHKKIATLSQNQFYYDALDMIFRQTYDLHLNMIKAIGTRYANYFHPAIADSLSRHDAHRAREVMRAHLEDFIARIGKE